MSKTRSDLGKNETGGGTDGNKGFLRGWFVPFCVIIGLLILNDVQMRYTGVNLNPLQYLYEWLGLRSPANEELIGW